MSFYAAASLCTSTISSTALFRHSAGGGNHHRRPSSSSRRSPWWGGSSSPSGLRVCTGSYMFDLSLSHVLDMARSWCIASFVNIVGSYGVSSLSIFLWWIESFPLRFRYCRIEYFGFENTWCMSCMGYPWWQWGILLSHLMYVLVINSRISVTLGSLGIWVGTRFHLPFSDRNFGVLFEVLCVDWIWWIWNCLMHIE